jgi:hypothetical protein
MLIDRISSFREKTISAIRENFFQFGLSETEKQFIADLN